MCPRYTAMLCVKVCGHKHNRLKLGNSNFILWTSHVCVCICVCVVCGRLLCVSFAVCSRCVSISTTG